MRLLHVLAFSLAVPAAAAEIQHDGVDCVVADRFPRLEARLSPPESVARARVSFRPENGKHWYSVPMKAEGDVFVGVLPRPRATLGGLRYYVEVTDKGVQTTRTPEFAAAVASGPAACQDKKVASSLASATVALEAPAGAPAIPAGFSSAGVSAAAAGAAVAGAAVGAGAAGAAAGGGGASTALLVGGGLAAAAGAAAVAVTAGGGEGGEDDCQGCPAVHFYSVMFGTPPNGIDVSSCAGRPLTWSGQSVPGNQGTLAADGAFDATWSPNEPNTMRVVGRATETSFTATLSCISGSGSGSLNASGSGGTYQGEWTFNNQRGNLTVQAMRNP